MTDIRLRAATPADAEALAALGRDAFKQTFGHLYQPDDLQQFLDGVYAPALQEQEILSPHTYVMLAGDADGALLGYAMTGPCKLPVPHPDEADYELHRIYLLAQAKGQGIGSALLQDALRYCKEKAASAVYVGVWSGNRAAQHFYRKHGFVHIANYHFMVGNQADDEWIMKLANTPRSRNVKRLRMR